MIKNNGSFRKDKGRICKGDNFLLFELGLGASLSLKNAATGPLVEIESAALLFRCSARTTIPDKTSATLSKF